MPRYTFGLVMIGAAAVFAVGALQWASRTGDPPELHAARVLPEPRPVTEFALLDHRGTDFTRRDLHGRWSLLFAGFSHCPDVCPMTLSLLGRLVDQLPEGDTPMQAVLLSVDPVRDTPERLAEYVGYFGGAVVGLTGDKGQIDALCDGLGLAYVHVPRGGDRYTIDHSAAVVLIDPRARVVGYFMPPLDAEAMHEDLLALARR